MRAAAGAGGGKIQLTGFAARQCQQILQRFARAGAITNRCRVRMGDARSLVGIEGQLRQMAGPYAREIPSSVAAVSGVGPQSWRERPRPASCRPHPVAGTFALGRARILAKRIEPARREADYMRIGFRETVRGCRSCGSQPHRPRRQTGRRDIGSRITASELWPKVFPSRDPPFGFLL